VSGIGMYRHFLLFLAFALVSSGALGFKTKSDCNSFEGAENAICYHQAAISYASFPSIENKEQAKSMCDKIKEINVATAEGQSNLCYADIAEMLLDKDICSNIKQSSTETILTGTDVTRELCEEKVEKIENIQSYNCALLFAVLFGFIGLASVVLFNRKN